MRIILISSKIGEVKPLPALLMLLVLAIVYCSIYQCGSLPQISRCRCHLHSILYTLLEICKARAFVSIAINL